MKNPPFIRHHGSIYRLAAEERTAQLQHYLQRYETLASKLNKTLPLIQKALQDSHKAAMGKQFDAALGILKNKYAPEVEKLTEAVPELKDLLDTMSGIAGMGGGA